MNESSTWEEIAATAVDGDEVVLSGWFMPWPGDADARYGLLLMEPACCGAAARPASSVEVHLQTPAAPGTRALTLTGLWSRLVDDPAGWRYQLNDARIAAPTVAVRQRSRRLFMGAGLAASLLACSPGRFAAYAQGATEADGDGDKLTRQWLAEQPTIDMHSHGGRIIVSRDPAVGAHRPLTPLSAPMREGGMNVICLAIVTDTVATRVSGDRKRFEAYREPAPGELYALAQDEFARVAELVASQQLQVITDAAMLRATRGPAVIIASEGADFLEGRIERVDEAYTLHGLRHLQLTHYRVNELGDIQTEPPVHGGLTDFGAAVVQRCNARGIVVDVAHGTFELVKRAAAVTNKPLVLSHTALSDKPGPRSRLISPAHAKLIASTGGVIGVWPSASSFADLDAMAAGARRLADVVGVDHVGLGTDLLGFISPPVFTSYRQLPRYAQALLGAGFNRRDAAKILGGNYQRVFEASMA